MGTSRQITGGSFKRLVGICAAAVAIALTASPAEAAKPSAKATKCTVKGSPAKLDVYCPSASLAELLTALGGATGLQSEYPEQIASARVSLVARRSSLSQVLQDGLDRFNFAVWGDEPGPAVTHVSIIGFRRDVEGVDTREARNDIAVADARETRSSARRSTADANGGRGPTAGEPEQRGASAPWLPAQERSRGAVRPAQPTQQALPASASPAASLAPAQASATLLSPPTAGATPLLPQRVDDAAILRPNGAQ